MQPFVHFFTMFYLYTTFPNRRSVSSYFLSFKFYWGFHRGLQLFCILFFSILHSYSVNCPILMTIWLWIFLMCLLVISKTFPRFWKCSFNFWSLSYGLAAWKFAHGVLFLPLTSFIVNNAICDCLSLFGFLILLIWAWIYTNYSI